MTIGFFALASLPSTTHTEAGSTEFLDQSTFFPFRHRPEDLADEFARGIVIAEGQINAAIRTDDLDTDFTELAQDDFRNHQVTSEAGSIFNNHHSHAVRLQGDKQVGQTGAVHRLSRSTDRLVGILLNDLNTVRLSVAVDCLPLAGESIIANLTLAAGPQIREGKIPAGIVLCVEALDRISRAEALKAINLVSGILLMDIDIGLVSDDKMLSQEYVAKNQHELHVAIAYLIRGQLSDTDAAVVEALLYTRADSRSGRRDAVGTPRPTFR